MQGAMVKRFICRLSELREGEAMRVDLEDRELLVAMVEGEIFITDAWCTHQRSDLTMGILAGRTVRCALHQALFRLDTGEVLEGPGGESPESIPRLKVYKPIVDGEEVYIEV